MRMLIAILFVGLINCMPPVASYIDGRRVLDYQDLRMARAEQVRGCHFLKQTQGEAKFRSSSARDEALTKAANLGADTVVITHIGSDLGIWRFCVVDAYYCAGDITDHIR